MSVSYSSEVLADSPLGYWRLGEASGTTMVDSSGNGRDGTYTSVTLAQTSLLSSDPDTAASFSSSRGVVNDAAWMDVTDFTVEAWIKPSTVTGAHAIISRDGPGGSRGWNLYQSGATLFMDNGTASKVSTGSVLAINAVHHVAMVYVSATSSISIYVDGALSNSGTLALTGTLANALAIGASRAGTGGFANTFSGVLDEAAYYGSALSSTRIAAHYAAATVTGTFAATLPLPVPSFTGSYAAPSVTGTLDATLPLPTPAFTGTYQAPPTGTFAATLTVPTIDFTGTYTAPPNPSGSFDAVLPVPAVDFTGGYTPPAESGTLDAGLPVPGLDFAGTYTPAPISGALDAALPVPVAAFTGTAAEATGAFAAVLPLPTVSFSGEYGGPYPTDTSNLFDGLNLVCLGTVTLARPAVTPPSNTAVKVDKAMPYPQPVMVDGRPT